MKRVYYNEFDPYAAQWLRNLIAAGHLPDGDVDERDIREVRADDVRGYIQQHYFAGVGGWPLALSLAGWPSDKPVQTGSPPCQPFSSAGARRGSSDSRHLWPEFRRLITECKPPTLFGEQVSSPLGRQWFSGVRADLEDLGYRVGGADLPAACVAAPHKRQRIIWVADMHRERLPQRTQPHRQEEQPQQQAPRRADARGRGDVGSWDRYDVIHFRDGKRRRIEPGLEPVVDGLSFLLADGRTRPGVSRSQAIKAISNALVVPLAVQFIRAYMQALEEPY